MYKLATDKRMKTPAIQNGHTTIPVDIVDIIDDFKGAGFGFVKRFLLLILLSVIALIAGIVFLVWNIGMNVNVEGTGVIEPSGRFEVKTKLSGIINEVYVGRWDKVAKGDRLLKLESNDWKAELEKVNKEREINRSKMAEIEEQMRSEKKILQSEIHQTQSEIETLRLQLEQVEREYKLVKKYNLVNRKSFQEIDQLLPIRLKRSMLRQAQAKLQTDRERLETVDRRRREIQTLKKMNEKLREDQQVLLRRIANTVVYASVSGTVLTGDLEKRVGDHLQMGEAVMELARLGDWQAKVMIKETEIHKVKVGQPVNLFVNAFPHMEYKIFQGVVTEIAAQPVSANPSQEAQVYPIKITISSSEVSINNNTYSLAYGMSVEAKIAIEKGRILDLIWSRFLRMAGKIPEHDFYIFKPKKAN